MRSVMTSHCTARWALVGCLLLAACNKEEQKDKAEADAGADAGPDLAQLDPELAQAMAKAKVGEPAASAVNEAGPPPRGIFPPGRADKEMKKGSPPKIDIGSDGADPKISLSPARPEPGSKISGKIQINLQQGQQGGGLPIEFGLTLESQKPKEAEAPAGSVKMSAKVTGASIPIAGAGKEAEGLIGKMKGTRVDYLVDSNGVGSAYKVEPPKGAPPELGVWLESLADTLALVTLPVPQKPLGVGAYWMVTTREGVLGLDLITYRMVKIEGIQDGVAAVSVNAKRYAASAALDLPGLPPGAPKEMSEFQSIAEGRLELKAGRGFPLGGDASNALAIGLGAAQGPGQRGQQQGVVIQTRATLEFGK